MRICKTISALVLGLAICALANSQPPAPGAADAKRAEALVQKLGSSRYAEREQAQKELEGMGAAALETLRKAAKQGDPEIAQRASDMVRRLEDKINSDTLLAPKKVKLSLKDVSVAEAVTELAKQSGYIVVLQNSQANANRKVTLETGEVSFFEALDLLCAKAGLVEREQSVSTVRPMPVRPRPINPGVVPAPGIAPVPALPPKAPAAPPAPPAVPQVQGQLEIEKIQAQMQAQVAQMQAQMAQLQAQIQAQQVPGVPQIQIVPLPGLQPVQAQPMIRPMQPRPGVGQPRQFILLDGKPAEHPTSYFGAVRVRVLPPAANVKAEAGETLFNLEVTAEPRLQNFQVASPPSIVQALDDKGQSLSAIEQKFKTVASPFGNIQVDAKYNPSSGQRVFPVRLKLGEKQAKTLTELAGTMTVSVQMPPAPVATINNVLKAAGESARHKDTNNVVMTLQSIEKVGDKGYKVQLVLESNQVNALNPFIGNGQIKIQIGPGMNQDLPSLVDANGKAYQTGPITSNIAQFINGAVKRTVTLEYRADAGQGEPAQLVVKEASNTTLAVPFSFKNVPLQ